MPERYNKAIVIGDVCVDVHLAIRDLLMDDVIKEVPYFITPGGTSGGSAVMLSKLGVDTSFLGTIGVDYGGRYLKECFEKLKIDTSLMIEKKDLNTINVFAFIDEQGERHLWGFPRVSQAYVDLDFNAVDINKIKTASWLHSSGMTLLKQGSIRESLPLLYKTAYEAGVPTSFDFNTRVKDLSFLDEEAVFAIENILLIELILLIFQFAYQKN